jgi:photosystem II stability/assembly factor-like uncharacterized protein
MRAPVILGVALCGAVCGVLLAGCGATRSVARPSTTTATTPVQATPASAPASTPASAPQQASTTLLRVAFSSPEQGYGLFEQRSTDGSSCTALAARTTDGGAHFERLGVIFTWLCADRPAASFLAFDDHGDGFAYGPKLFVTHDGGSSWAPVAEPGPVTAVAALGYSVWMIEGRCPPGRSTPGNTCALRLSESTDGGRSWTPSPGPLPEATVTSGALSLEPALGQNWLLRTSPSAAYVVSSPMPNQSGAADSVPLWYTPDGGSTWTAHQIPCGLDALSASVAVAPDGTLTAVCAGEPGAGEQLETASVSHDGGRTWAVHDNCPTGPGSSQCSANNPLDFGYLGSIDSVSAGTTFLVGGRSSLLVTRDGGTTWRPVQPLIGGTDSGTTQVIFFDGHDGLVLGTDSGSGQQAIWHTADTGAHWSNVSPRLV